MSIATEISRIKDAKDAIRASIIAKGVNVPQAAKLDTYADRIDEIVQTASGNMEVVTSSPSGTINAADNKFYMLSGDAGALVFNLPAMQQGGHGIYLLMTTASTSVVSFTSTGSVPINFPTGFQVEADKCYLMDFEFAQSAWQVSVEEWFVNGGGGDLPAKVKAIEYNDWGMPTYIYFTDYALSGYTFFTGVAKCQTLERVKYDGTTLYDTSGASMYGFKQCTNLRYVDMPNVTTPYRSEYFTGCTSLYDLSFPKLVTIPTTSFLKGITNLRRVRLDELETTNTQMLANIKMLNDVYFPKVKSIGDSCFYYSDYNGASGNLHLTLPNTVTSVGNNAFNNNQIVVTFTGTTPPSFGTTPFVNNCSPIYVPEESIDAYKTTTNLAQYADRIKPIGWTPTVPEGAKVHSWKTNGFDTIPEDESGTLTASELISIKNSAGYVILSSSITSLKKDTFQNCTLMRRIYMPSVTSLEDNAYNQAGTFAGCAKLVEIDLTNAQAMSDGHLQYGCFRGCSNLYKVKLPASFNNFYYASSSNCSPFSGCNCLSEIWIYATEVYQGPYDYTFFGCTEINSLDPDRASIYVLPELVDAYKTNRLWKKYAAIIKPMPTE